VAWAAVWSYERANTHTCPTLDITITDFAKRQYVTASELVTLLKKNGLYPVGKTASTIETQQIENFIRNHPMVRKAECYILPDGTVCVRLSQRIPVLRVVTGDMSYFVDTDRTKMPVRESVTTPVLVATGNIGERMACNELADLVLWLEENSYWKEKIQSIHVVHPKMVYLIQRPDGTHIILGEISGFRQKLGKLRTLYDKGFDEIGWQTYQELDLRYAGQVIGRNLD
jgi:cell division protein FtsQ